MMDEQFMSRRGQAASGGIKEAAVCSCRRIKQGMVVCTTQIFSSLRSIVHVVGCRLNVSHCPVCREQSLFAYYIAIDTVGI